MRLNLPESLIPDLNETDVNIIVTLLGAESDFSNAPVTDEESFQGLQKQVIADSIGKSKSHVSERVDFLVENNVLEKFTPESSKRPRIRLRNPEKVTN